MDWQQISDHTSMRLTEDERQIIAAILEKNPHLGGKLARAVSLALYTWKGVNIMKGVNTSQARAEELEAQGFEVYVDSETGFWVRVDNISRHDYQYKVYKTGDVVGEIPDSATLGI